METTTVCFDLVSLFDLGWESLMTLGFARVETIRKNNSKMNRMSFNGPVCTSPSSLCLFLRFILIAYYLPLLSCRLLENVNKLPACCFHFIGGFVYLRV